MTPKPNLNKTDIQLLKQTFATKEDLGIIIDQKLEAKFEQKLAPINARLGNVEKAVTGINQTVAGIKQETNKIKGIELEIKAIEVETKKIPGIEQETNKISGIKQDTKKIKKDTTDLLNFFDRDLMNLRKRTQRLESHLELPALP